ncbi:uncharacterized protein B0I36DRAFT_364198 [Microdochium trichocladiopsis]|uniref:DUF3295 domain-containing protein n=1 Tax=Microdochium trichocladiopsis TaxID=1682393 RepID=A0A9P9BPX6_9PEZI|nr:uncharacterized protein B0I36DRAFT_364198 [Microdochium trichocladiopsis]KAH7029697.1 hypothetical protein B0I36DRAFT_364198 [Microdochium trichocladiopsis]
MPHRLSDAEAATAAGADTAHCKSFGSILAEHRQLGSEAAGESAIDDSDAEWTETESVSEDEDKVQEKNPRPEDVQLTFERDTSRLRLTAQTSLLSLLLMTEGPSTKVYSNYASQGASQTTQNKSTIGNSPNDSDGGLQMKKTRDEHPRVKTTKETRRPPPQPGLTKGARLRPPHLNTNKDIPRSNPRPVPSDGRTNHDQAVLSPRTIHRNIAATELTESLRRELRWMRENDLTVKAVKEEREKEDIEGLTPKLEKMRLSDRSGNDENYVTSWDNLW